MSDLFATKFMMLALEAAAEAEYLGEVPVGAVVVDYQQSQVVALGGNAVIATSDPTGHAEMVVIRKAASLLNAYRLTQCDLYVTLEPCPMCAQAISFARFRRVIFGAYDPKGGGIEHGPKLYQQTTCFHKPEVVGGILEQECRQLLTSFFYERRGV